MFETQERKFCQEPLFVQCRFGALVKLDVSEKSVIEFVLHICSSIRSYMKPVTSWIFSDVFRCLKFILKYSNANKQKSQVCSWTSLIVYHIQNKDDGDQKIDCSFILVMNLVWRITISANFTRLKDTTTIYENKNWEAGQKVKTVNMCLYL